MVGVEWRVDISIVMCEHDIFFIESHGDWSVQTGGPVNVAVVCCVDSAS
jgi:hypothetical protein